MNYTLIGLPITKFSASKEFYDFFESKNIICIMSTFFNIKNPEISYDYTLAKYGYDYLIKKGFDFITKEQYDGSSNKIIMLKDIWWNNGVRCTNTPQVASEIEYYISSIIDDKHTYAHIVPGSPFYGSSLCKYLNPKKIIGTTSSAQLIYYEMKKLGYEKELHRVNRFEYDIKSNCINVLPCIGDIYSGDYDYNILLSLLNDNMKAYAVRIGYNETIQPMTIECLRESVNNHKNYWNDKTLVLIT